MTALGGTLAAPLERWYRPVMFGLAFAAVVMTALQAAQELTSPVTNIHAGMDFLIYWEAGRRWMAGDGFYLAHQLAGPYVITHGDVLYPPPTLLVFAPLGLLPYPVAAVIFGLVPLAALAGCLWRHRPAPWALAVVAVCLWFPVTGDRAVSLNPVLWSMAAVALGTARPFFAPFALLKVTVGAWAFGAWKREWWVGLGVVVALSALFLPMWFDWARVMLDSDGQLTRSLHELPLVLAPVVAWAGRASRAGAPAGRP